MFPGALGTGVGIQGSSESRATNLLMTWLLWGDGHGTPPFTHLDWG